MSLSQELNEVKQGLQDERKNVRRIADQTERKLELVLQQLSTIEGRMTPNNMKGFIRNYRFGMNGEAIKHPTDEELPTHRFDLDVGQQVWLHVVVGSAQWDSFMAANEKEIPDEFDDTSDIAAFWDGKRIEITRNPSLGRFVPVRILGVKPLAEDCNGNTVYEGDRVKMLDSSNSEAEVRGIQNSYFTVRRDDGTPGGGPFDESYGEFGAKLYLISPGSTELID